MMRKQKNVEPPPGRGGYDSKLVSEMTTYDPPKASRLYKVQQHLREEVDVNTIVRRFGITGQMPVGVKQGLYGDFSGITDYSSAVEAIERAQNGFMKLPAEVRERFNNDPSRLADFARTADEQTFGRATSVTPAAPKAPEAPKVPEVIAPKEK